MSQAKERLELKEKKDLLLNRMSKPVDRINYSG